MSLECRILRSLRYGLRSRRADAAMRGASRLGDYGTVWLIAAYVMLCFRSQRRAALEMLLSLAVESLLCCVLLKPFSGRRGEPLSLRLILPRSRPSAGPPHRGVPALSRRALPHGRPRRGRRGHRLRLRGPPSHEEALPMKKPRPERSLYRIKFLPSRFYRGGFFLFPGVSAAEAGPRRGASPRRSP